MDRRIIGLSRWLAGLPTRIVHGVPWAHVEPAGLGIGTPETGDVDEREARKRRARETWRSTDDGATR
jgi:hypothetical protein